MKEVKAKPSFYAVMFEPLKRIAITYGYNLVIHGSLDRDMDLIAIPWVEDTGSVRKMITDFKKMVHGDFIKSNPNLSPHGRKHYVISLTMGDFGMSREHWYLDISVMPTARKKTTPTKQE